MIFSKAKQLFANMQSKYSHIEFFQVPEFLHHSLLQMDKLIIIQVYSFPIILHSFNKCNALEMTKSFKD